MELGLISVDKWTVQAQAYFLTHLHADHTNGLSAKWAKGPLYCSPITAKLIPLKIPGLNRLLIRVLETGKTYSLELVSSRPGPKVLVQVTSIDAHHCHGAVMFLFRGEFGCELHTGDFRWETTNDKEIPGKEMLLEALKGDKVDILYLDNTYCNPSFSFPPRHVAAQQVIDVISSYPERDIVIGIDSLGKEDLLLRISEVLKTKIWVWPARLQMMHLLGFEESFTAQTCLTRVRAVPRNSLTVGMLQALNTVRPTIGIVPSGLPWGLKAIKKQFSSLGCIPPSSPVNSSQMDETTSSVTRVHQYIYKVPYSLHSCFSEIQEFIKLVQPSIMMGNLSSSFCYVNPNHFFGYMCRDIDASAHCKYLKPECIAEGKVVYGESTVECAQFNTVMINRVRATKLSRLRMRISWVNKMRRKRRGAKLEYVESFG
ncbi:5' exonuclease Apollo [Amborella trichopoda]|uniref:5' exonuclease Apollo n=1 Tax=Amborella trichopoda TaxID=13333 RepID=W1NP92_AMBTC|nr:5' exonuclease Apollo [Amborella trichopoda]ERM98376.1 hypothetical protein AMTR_s00072p00037420 [Amborella trichopoda]|eukprot:XP_006833098.1 5' exonuclease Apollo [Amborella trichopoda]